MPKSTRHRLIARVILWGTLIVVVPIGILAFAWLLTLPDVQPLAQHNPTSTALIEHRLAMASKQGRAASKRWNLPGIWKLAHWLKDRGVTIVHSQTYNAHSPMMAISPTVWPGFISRCTNTTRPST